MNLKIQPIQKDELRQFMLNEAIKLDWHYFVCFHSVLTAVNFYDRLGYINTNLKNLFYSLDLKQVQTTHIEFPTTPENGTFEELNPSQLKPIHDYYEHIFNGESGLNICNFNKHWLQRSNVILLAYKEQSQYKGYGVLTRCLYSEKDNLNSYRLAPLYADSEQIASLLLKNLVKIAMDKKAKNIEMNTLEIVDEQFKTQLANIGFFAKGHNYIVSNNPKEILKASTYEHRVFASIPLEYPHEITNKLSK